MSGLELDGLSKAFGAGPVVRDFSLALREGEFVSLLGPSGCGKTTVLRMVAGFETPDRGRIAIAGREVTAEPPARRRIGMVFQSYALFPNLTVADNIGFGLRVAGTERRQTGERVAGMLALIGLPELGARYPFQLSGGQQQRVALARALAPHPRVLLLDEPLSALDARVRVALRGEIRRIQRELGITTLFVTHDQEEAMSISDRVVVMNGGRAEQVGTPAAIYDRPATRFVASFVGTLNQIEGVAEAGGTVRLGALALPQPPGSAVPAGRPMTLAIRPEAVPAADQRPDLPAIEGRVIALDFLGPVIRLRVAAEALGPGVTLVVDRLNGGAARAEASLAPGAPIRLALPPETLIALAD